MYRFICILIYLSHVPACDYTTSIKREKKNAHKLAKYHTVLYKSGTVVNTMLFRAYTEGPVGLHIHVTQAKSKSTALENTAETGRTNHSLM